MKTAVVNYIVTLSIPEESNVPESVLPFVLRNSNDIIEMGRLKLAFTQFLAWRHRLVHVQRKKVVPLLITSTGVDLFPARPESEAKLFFGDSRNLATQLALAYEGASMGFDAIGAWSVQPLGMFCEAKIRTEEFVAESNPDALEEFQGKVIRVEVVRTLRSAVTQMDLQQKQLELHKIEAFVSYFLARTKRVGEKWRPFPPTVSLETLTKLQVDLAKKIYFPEAKEMHRGMLLYGPAGTGKSSSARTVIKHFRIHCVWGYNEYDEPIIGTGAALKGGLQGDLEMRIFALFMRGNAAPWLPTVITVDEIDFTAPSRKAVGSQDSGGNLWLERLSDDVRPKHVTFMATTNVRANILEQLVDRLDNVFVGLLEWEDVEDAITKFIANGEWPNSMFKNPEKRSENPPIFFGKDQLGNDLKEVRWFHAVLLGMPPRSMKTLRSLDDIDSVQLNSYPWPTLSWGPVSAKSLLSPSMLARTVQSDCGALLRFLLWGQQKQILSGRMLVDITRLRERIMVVEVEVINDLSVIKDDVLFIDSTQHSHVHQRDRRGQGHCFTRTFILYEQDNEAGLWATLLRFALSTRAIHCTYVSETFLRSFSGESQAGADERNRAAISTAIMQYITNCERAVLVMPLSHARIQKPEDSKGSLASSSNINAHEVWDLITSSWRAHDKKKQMFVLVASEEWEIDAVTGSSTISWQESEYRAHINNLKQEELRCINGKCNRKFSSKSAKDRQGCAHDSVVILYEPGADNQYRTCSKSTSNVVTTRSDANPEIAIRAKWLCCGKPFLERECPNRKHQKPRKFEKAKTTQTGKHQEIHDKWWCNYCCSVISSNGCTK